MPPVLDRFYDRDPRLLAPALLGKVLRRRWEGRWLAARIIETEAYLLTEKASHSSLGRTRSREPMFMPPGTLYLYHSRGGDSLNLSAGGEGNAVLLKSGHPWVDERSPPEAVEAMRRLHPKRDGELRPFERLCAGQTHLCRALGVRRVEWTGRRFDPEEFFLDDVGERPSGILRTTRLGIPEGRDGHLMYRWIDEGHARWCTSDPRRKRGWRQGTEWERLRDPDAKGV